MTQRELISFMALAEKLKCRTRHSWTSTGRRESVAEHSWRLSLMSLLLQREFPDLDMNRVTAMCLVHDLGEAITGDIPSFDKTQEDEDHERQAVSELLSALPQDTSRQLSALFEEIFACHTPEAHLFHALDRLEAVMSHNEAPLSTWIPLEYSENLTYGQQQAEFFAWTAALRQELYSDSVRKIAQCNCADAAEDG